MPPRSSDPVAAPPSLEPHGTQALEAALGAVLDPVLSSRRSAAPLAHALEGLDRAAQDFVLHWAGVIARSNAELAYQFTAAAPEALTKLDRAAAENWVLHAMDVYDREGLQQASVAFREAAACVEPRNPAGVDFAEVASVLQLFVQGLAGRPMRIETAANAYTDTETIYLPPRMTRGRDREENFLLYKATTALLWAQSRYGTFNVDLIAACAAYPDASRALSLVTALESVRLHARLVRSLPGLARDVAARVQPLDDARCARLLERDATISDTLEVLGEIYDAPPAFAELYSVTLEPRQAAATRAKRLEREKDAFQSALAELLDDSPDGESIAFTLENAGDERAPGEAAYVLTIDGEAADVPPDMAELIDSIVQDLGGVPQDYLAARTAETSAGEAESAEPHDDANVAVKHVYDEWDCFRQHYRKRWCTVRELDVPGGDAAFVERTLARHDGEIRSLRRSFERLRDEERVLRKQPDGDGIDFDALVEAYGDSRSGAEVSPLVFTRRHRIERDLAVMFMVDMSGSTKGWINDAEREALLMLCEALEALGDRYAIYGFSGLTRHRCEVYRVKQFAEAYDEGVRERIAGIEPQDYTRMGAAIRHVSTVLNDIAAGTKLLITLSDGRPDDYSDEYRGQYGIEDTRMALLEAHRSGIRPFCITIDREARDYLPHMYGQVNWILVDDVARLPSRIAHIYRRLTA